MAPPARRLNVRSRTRPAPGCTPPAEEPDLALYDMVGLDEGGRPLPLDDGRGPSLGLQIEVSRIVADRLLRDAIAAIDAMLGVGSAKRRPELVVAHMRAATAFADAMRQRGRP